MEGDLFVVTVFTDGREVIGAYLTELEALRRVHDYHIPDAKIALVSPGLWPETYSDWETAMSRYQNERG